MDLAWDRGGPHARRGFSSMVGAVMRVRGFVIVLVGWVAAAGCGRVGYDPQFACPGDPRCEAGGGRDAGGPDADAPDPGSRDAGSDRDGGALGDAAVDAGEMPPVTPGCGSLQLLQETFSGNQTRSVWSGRWSGAARASVVNERVVLRLEGGGGSARANYRTMWAFDFRNSEIAVEVPQVGGRETRLEVREGVGRDRFNEPISAQDGGVALAVVDGVLQAHVLDGEATTVRFTTAYDPASHRYWRLRHRGRDVLWETSPDRRTWQIVHREASPMAPDTVWVNMVASGQQSNATEAWFDDVNTPTDDVPSLCAADASEDDFEDGALALRWRPWNGAGTCYVREAGGAAELRYPSGETFSLCQMLSSAPLAFVDRAASFEIAHLPRTQSFAALFELTAPVEQHSVRVRIVGDTALLQVVRKPSPMDPEIVDFEVSLAFDLTTHRHWRFRESGGRVFWETSPDGATWTTRAETEMPFDARAVMLSFGGHRYADTGAEEVVRIESVNRN